MLPSISREDFAQQVQAHLTRALLPGSFTLDVRAFVVSVRNERVTMLLSLERFYRAYEGASAADGAPIFATIAAVCQPPTLSEETRSEVLPLLMPRVKARAHLEGAKYGIGVVNREVVRSALATAKDVVTPPLPYEVLADHLGVAIALDRPDRVETVLDPSRFGASFEQLLAMAYANAKQRIAEDFQEVTPGVFTAGEDDYAAERILFPERMTKLAIDGDPVVFLATPNLIVVTGSNDDVGIGSALLMAVAAAKKGPEVALFPFVYRDGAWSLFDTETRVGARAKAFESALQTTLLPLYRAESAAHAETLLKKGDTRRVPALEIVRRIDDPHPATLSVWKKRTVTLLPMCEYVRLDVGADWTEGSTKIVRWKALFEQVGQQLRRVPDCYPPRWETTGFPSKEALASLHDETRALVIASSGQGSRHAELARRSVGPAGASPAMRMRERDEPPHTPRVGWPAAIVAIALACALVWLVSPPDSRTTPAALPYVLLGGGLFSTAGAAFEWRFFMSDLRVRFLTVILGREGTRALYMILGVALACAGLGYAFQVLG